jgi:hypothetical protein
MSNSRKSVIRGNCHNLTVFFYIQIRVFVEINYIASNQFSLVLEGRNKKQGCDTKKEVWEFGL